MPEYNLDVLSPPPGEEITRNTPPWLGGCWGWVHKLEGYGPTPTRVLWKANSGCEERFRAYSAEWTEVPI